MKYFQLIRITGGANAVKYDDGLKSTETEKKRLVAVHVQMDAYAATDDNEIQGWHERAKIFELPEKMFSTEVATATSSTAGREKMPSVPVDLEIPVGESFKLAIKCAATAINVRGAYEYEIVT